MQHEADNTTASPGPKPSPLALALAASEHWGGTIEQAQAFFAEFAAQKPRGDVNAVATTAIIINAARAYERQAPRPLYVDTFCDLFMPPHVLRRVQAAYEPWFMRQTQAGKVPPPGWVSMGSRTWYIDERVRQACEAGTRQIVLLGCGLDCRALRLELPAGVRFVEVDDDALLDYKLEVLAEHGHRHPPGTKFIRGDYLSFDLCAALEQAGVDPAQDVLFVWEGNTMYLPPDKSRALLRDILARFPRSTVVFDYLVEPAASPSGQPRTDDPDADEQTAIFMRAASTDGRWLWIGPWDQQLSQRECGFEIVEQLSFAQMVRAARGPQLTRQLYERYPQLSAGVNVAYHFCVVRPKPAE